jgi:predicted ATP-dependent endonuclease of OLD family
MKIKSIKIHNFRSIKEIQFDCYDYNVIVGPNDSGKSNIIDAIRIFYEDDIKFDEQRDFPKLRDLDDNESWIEIEYRLTDDEFRNLKDEYKRPGNTLKVRKYLKPREQGKVKSNQSNIYGYEGDNLSNNLFYGAKNISEAKLGAVTYIPAVSTTAEVLKLSGPSPLRNVLYFVMQRVTKSGTAYNDLKTAIDAFNDKFQKEQSEDGLSFNRFKEEINKSLSEWMVEFDLSVNPIKPEDIIKSLLEYALIDKNLGEEIDVDCFGEGLQRHLIYTLLKLSTQYTEKKTYEKKEFAPEFNLILFEEPEAFLNPFQQDSLNFSLKSLSNQEGQQVIITTHSPVFVSKNLEELSSLIKIRKDNGITKAFQTSDDILEEISQFQEHYLQFLSNQLNEPALDEATRRDIETHIDELKSFDFEAKAVCYSLWLDSERCSAFFADTVLICEGATEKTFINYLLKNKWNDLQKKIYVLDAMGKYNIHIYMNLFKELGIRHSVLADTDQNNKHHTFVNQFIESQRNEFTIDIHFFDNNLEAFLNISPCGERWKKPVNVIWNYLNGKIPRQKIDELQQIIKKVIGEAN